VSAPASIDDNKQLMQDALRGVALQEAIAGPCPRTGGPHTLTDGEKRRLGIFGGHARCTSCQMELRLLERSRVDGALSIVEASRVYAGLPRFTELQRAYLRTLLGARDPIITAAQEVQLFADLADMVPDDVVTPTEAFGPDGRR
jgi:hypothetical protein